MSGPPSGFMPMDDVARYMKVSRRCARRRLHAFNKQLEAAGNPDRVTWQASEGGEHHALAFMIGKYLPGLTRGDAIDPVLTKLDQIHDVALEIRAVVTS